VWEDETERRAHLNENLLRIHSFRGTFPEFGQTLPELKETLPGLLTKLYSDCQNFAELEIGSLLKRFEYTSSAHIPGDPELAAHIDVAERRVGRLVVRLAESSEISRF
jgi:hypothetical protein